LLFTQQLIDSIRNTAIIFQDLGIRSVYKAEWVQQSPESSSSSSRPLGLEQLACEERLKKRGLFSLEKRK